MAKKEGVLILSPGWGDDYRLDIRYPDGTYYGGLHCGETIEVFRDVETDTVRAAWVPARVEADVDGEWYLAGMYKPGEIPSGLMVRK